MSKWIGMFTEDDGPAAFTYDMQVLNSLYGQDKEDAQDEQYYEDEFANWGADFEEEIF